MNKEMKFRALNEVPMSHTMKTGVDVDCPREGEVVAAPECRIRVRAPAEATEVEVSISQCPWEPCRREAGSWSYDWSSYDDGDYQLAARARIGADFEEAGEERLFSVRLRR
ncbi:MAG: hypothetical protein HYZ75_03685 [Elusimicrobia bacterium]|nr:hypothetical protein [Elusimicrobiota bacterium]